MARYRLSTAIVYQQQQQQRRQALSVLRCIDAGGVGELLGVVRRRRRARGQWAEAAVQRVRSKVKRKAMLGNGRPGVLAAASASSVEVGRTVKPQDFGRARASPLQAPRSEAAVACCVLPVCARLAAQGPAVAQHQCARKHASTVPKLPASRALGRLPCCPHQPAATPCCTLRDVSLLCVCPPGPSSPPCHLVCPGELVMRAVLLPAA